MSKHPVQGFVYVVYDRDKQRHKIGKTTNIQRRVKQLQTGNSTELEIVYYRAFPDYSKAEHTIHAIFAANRKLGEWFSLSRQHKELLDKIFTLTGLNQRDKESLERLDLLPK